MRYKNTKTGVVIDSPRPVFGGDWVLVEKPKEEPKTSRKAKNKE